LIMPLGEMVRIKNIASLFARLMTLPDRKAVAVGFELEIEGMHSCTSEDLVGIANALATPGNGPVVRIGIEGFEDSMSALWANLWPEARAGFGFRLSFGPTDIVENPGPSVVCTPAALSSRWVRHRVVNGLRGKPAVSRVAGFLVGEIDAAPVLAFGRELDADLHRLDRLLLLDRAHTLVSEIEGCGFDGVLAAVRLLDSLSPDPSSAVGVKAAMGNRLAELTASASPDQILTMRNLRLVGFVRASEIWQSVENWLAVRKFEAADDASMVSMVDYASLADAAVEGWREAMILGMARAASMGYPGMPRAAWRWVQARPDLTEAIFVFLPDEPAFGQRMASATPRQMEATLARKVLTLALARGWLAVHGAVLSAFDEPMSAARRQVAVDRDTSEATGVRLALRAARPAQLLECAVEVGDSRIIDLAAEAVAAEPEVFVNASCRSVHEQAVWEKALGRNEEAWRAPRIPTAARDAVLNAAIDGGALHEPLLAALARTPLADLCDFARRERLWAAAENSVAAAYLRATAHGWFRRSSQGQVPFLPDPPLKSALLTGTSLEAALSGATDLAHEVGMIIALNGPDEQRFRNWLRTAMARGGTMRTSDAEALGRIVITHDWHAALDEIVLSGKRRTDLMPALRACASMFGFLARWELGISMPTTSEKWEWFADLAADLYSSGPRHDGIWSRAGGKDSDLPEGVTGRSAWRTVLGRVRNGGSPSAERLLKSMLGDYAGNQALRHLAADRDIIGYR
ncbi:MAG: effector-associated domain EAD1-containing protein, partial [Janthinobacterium lividum]